MLQGADAIANVAAALELPQVQANLVMPLLRGSDMIQRTRVSNRCVCLTHFACLTGPEHCTESDASRTNRALWQS